MHVAVDKLERPQNWVGADEWTASEDLTASVNSLTKTPCSNCSLYGHVRGKRCRVQPRRPLLSLGPIIWKFYSMPCPCCFIFKLIY